jgi:hypothetical protein
MAPPPPPPPRPFSKNQSVSISLSLSLSLGEGVEGLSAFKRQQCPVQKILEKVVMGFID